MLMLETKKLISDELGGKIHICFRLFIFATGCRSEQRPKKTVIVVKGDSARRQNEISESSAWLFSVLGVKHRHTGSHFKVSSELETISNCKVTRPGIEPTTASFK